MKVRERTVVFPCNGERLIGVLHAPDPTAERGVLIIVGGPQTRVGSHRQFLLLARWLAARGFPVLRFDYRGMGDSGGEAIGFERVEDDIAAALDAFFEEAAGLREVVLWGLCDAASAAMMYARRDPRVKGLVLANPWIRSESGMARAYLRHYYLSRLADKEYWAKLFSGKFDFVASLRSLLDLIRKALPGRHPLTASGGPERQEAGASLPFPERMRRGLEGFQGPVLMILSGDDLTAAEFKDTIAASRLWRRLIGGPNVTRRDCPEANHTFSSRLWRDQVAGWTEQWLRSW